MVFLICWCFSKILQINVRFMNDNVMIYEILLFIWSMKKQKFKKGLEYRSHLPLSVDQMINIWRGIRVWRGGGWRGQPQAEFSFHWYLILQLLCGFIACSWIHKALIQTYEKHSGIIFLWWFTWQLHYGCLDFPSYAEDCPDFLARLLLMKTDVEMAWD